MATYQITAPNGKTYVTEGPDNATPEQVTAVIMRAHPEAASAEEEGFFPAMGRALDRNVPFLRQAYAQVTEDAPAIIGSALSPFVPGLQGIVGKNLGRAISKSEAYRGLTSDTIAAERAAAKKQLAEIGARKYKGVFEEEGIGRKLGSLAETVVESALPVGAGVATGLITRSPVAAGLVMTAGNAPMTYGGIRERQKAEGIDDVQLAVVGTAVSAALDTLTGVGGKVLSGTAAAAARELLEAGLKQAAIRVVKSGGAESGTEILQNIVEQVAGGTNPATKKAMLETLEAGLAGALGGTVFTGASEVIAAPFRRKGPLPAEEKSTGDEDADFIAATQAAVADPSNQAAIDVIAKRYMDRNGLPPDAAERYARASVAKDRATQAGTTPPSGAEETVDGGPGMPEDLQPFAPDEAYADEMGAPTAPTAPPPPPAPNAPAEITPDQANNILNDDVALRQYADSVGVDEEEAISRLEQIASATPEVVAAPIIQPLSPEEQAAQAEGSRAYNQRQRTRSSAESNLTIYGKMVASGQLPPTPLINTLAAQMLDLQGTPSMDGIMSSKLGLVAQQFFANEASALNEVAANKTTPDDTDISAGLEARAGRPPTTSADDGLFGDALPKQEANRLDKREELTQRKLDLTPEERIAQQEQTALTFEQGIAKATQRNTEVEAQRLAKVQNDIRAANKANTPYEVRRVPDSPKPYQVVGPEEADGSREIFVAEDTLKAFEEAAGDLPPYTSRPLSAQAVEGGREVPNTPYTQVNQDLVDEINAARESNKITDSEKASLFQQIVASSNRGGAKKVIERGEKDYLDAMNDLRNADSDAAKRAAELKAANIAGDLRRVANNIVGNPVRARLKTVIGQRTSAKRLAGIRTTEAQLQQNLGARELEQPTQAIEELKDAPEKLNIAEMRANSNEKTVNKAKRVLEKAQQRKRRDPLVERKLQDVIDAAQKRLDIAEAQIGREVERKKRLEAATETRKRLKRDMSKESTKERDAAIEAKEAQPTRAGLAEQALLEDPDAAEAKYVEDNLKGKSAVEAADWLAKNAPSALDRVIATQVAKTLRLLEKLGFKTALTIANVGDMRPVGMNSARGYFKPGVKPGEISNVWLHGADVEGLVGTSYRTALHELVHAATVLAFRMVNRSPAKYAGTQIGQAVNDLKLVSNAFINHFNSRVKDSQNGGAPLTEFETAMYKSYINVSANFEEVIAWALSSRDMQDYLATIPYKSTNKSILSKFVDAIRKLFAIKGIEDTALAEVLRASEGLMTTSEEQLASVLGVQSSDMGPAQGSLGFADKSSKGPEAQINRGVRKAQLSSGATFFEGLDEASHGWIDSAKEDAEIRLEAVDAALLPAKLVTTTTSSILEAIKRMSPAVGSVVEQITASEQRMRGMQKSMQKAMGRRVREFKKFVHKYGQEVISAMMTIARVNRVDVTSANSLDELLKNDRPAKRYRGYIADPSMSPAQKRAYAGHLKNREDDIRAAWAAWEKLGQQKGGHELYKQQRQFHKDMYTAMRAEADENIRSMGMDEESTNRLIAEAHTEDSGETLTDEDDRSPGIPEKLFPDEYFPFSRFGSFVLLVKDAKGRERERYHKESAYERNKVQLNRARQLGLKRGTDEYDKTFTQLNELEDQKNSSIANESVMLKKMFKIIDESTPLKGFDVSQFATQDKANKAAKDQLKDKLQQTYLMTLPERNLRKQFLHAELITGNSADALRVFKNSVTQYSSQLPKLIFGREAQRLIETAYDAIENSERPPTERAKLRTLVNAYVGRYRETVNPTNTPGTFENIITEFTVLSMLSGPVTAALQLISVPLQSMPRMAARYGYIQTLKVMDQYMPVFDTLNVFVDVDPATGEKHFSAPSLGNANSVKNNPLRRRFWVELNDRRDLFSQHQTEMRLRDRPTRTYGTAGARNKVGNAYESMVRISTTLLGSADQLSREMVGMAFAELHYNKLRSEGKSSEEAFESAVEAAIKNTDDTLGNYTDLDKMTALRGDWLRRFVAFLRNYAAQRTKYYVTQFMSVVKGSPYQTRMQAVHELTTTVLLGAMAGGVKTIFGYSAACILIDTLMKTLLSDEDKDRMRREDPLAALNSDYWLRYRWIPRNFGPTVTRIAQRGVLSLVTGADLGPRISQNDLWLREVREGRTPSGTLGNFIQDNISPKYSEAKQLGEAMDEFSEGNISRGFSKATPAGVRGWITANRLETEGELSDTGDVIMAASEFTPAMLRAQRLGAVPLKLAEIREQNRAIIKFKMGMKNERTKLITETRRMLTAPHTDQDALAARDKIIAFNNKVPIRVVAGITYYDPEYFIELKDIIQSAKTAAQKDRKTIRGVEMSNIQRAYLQ